MFETNFITKGNRDLVVSHESEPVWDENEEGYNLPNDCDYGIKSIVIVEGDRTKEVKLTESILAKYNEMIEDKFTPQFMR